MFHSTKLTSLSEGSAESNYEPFQDYEGGDKVVKDSVHPSPPPLETILKAAFAVKRVDPIAQNVPAARGHPEGVMSAMSRNAPTERGNSKNAVN